MYYWHKDALNTGQAAYVPVTMLRTSSSSFSPNLWMVPLFKSSTEWWILPFFYRDRSLTFLSWRSCRISWFACH